MSDSQLKKYPKKIHATLKGLALGTKKFFGTPKGKYLKRMLKNTLRVYAK